MATIKSEVQTWTAVAGREDTDNWADVKLSKTIMLAPDTVTVTFTKTNRMWVFSKLRVSGQAYRPLKSGTRDPHGTRSYEFGGGLAPDEYHALIITMRDRADTRS